MESGNTKNKNTTITGMLKIHMTKDQKVWIEYLMDEFKKHLLPSEKRDIERIRDNEYYFEGDRKLLSHTRTLYSEHMKWKEQAKWHSSGRWKEYSFSKSFPEWREDLLVAKWNWREVE